MSLCVLVAFDDLLLRHLGKLIAIAHTFHIADGLTAQLVDHAEGNRVLIRESGRELHRDEDEGQAEIA
jgi:hypothetical protein